VIENPNPNPIFKMDGQSNANLITIQQFLEKDKDSKYKMAKFYDKTLEFPRAISY